MANFNRRRHSIALGTLLRHVGRIWHNLQKHYELRLAKLESGTAVAGLPTLDECYHPAQFAGATSPEFRAL